MVVNVTAIRYGIWCLIYAIRMGTDGPIKIGKTSELTPAVRRGMLQIGNPYKLHVIGAVLAPSELEAQLHNYLHEHRMESEWFAPHPEVLATVQFIINKDLDGLLKKFHERLMENEEAEGFPETTQI
jgi:hypothetical protein